MAPVRKTKEEELLESEKVFSNNAFLIVFEMLEMSSEPSASMALMDEVLHSILFLGKINKPPYSPEMIFTDELLEELKINHPQPFDLYSSQLPRRSPFSCVLDMIVHLSGERNEDDIKHRLQELNHRLSRGNLISSTICVSQNTATPGSARYYGVSMSTSGGIPGQIMVAASCHSSWDNHVAEAVMTYYSNMVKKNYFDGTLRLPEKVRCQAFSLSSGDEMLPCVSCGDMFGLHTTNTKKWAHGNCAEVESVSNLFKNESEIKEQARPRLDTNTEGNRLRARRNALSRLMGLLEDVGFNWDNKFYPNIEFDRKKAKLVMGDTEA